jgi:Protein of unknown function (DUF1696).
MTNDLQPFAVWTFIMECPVPNDVSSLLVSGETPVCAYKTIRDVAVFTNKRLIVRDAEGLTGKKSGNVHTSLFIHRYVFYRKCW